MSGGGWIKFEKDLLTDPRVLAMAEQLRSNDKIEACCNAHALHHVTLVLGGLAQLWFLCDTHIGQDDVLPIGVNEINQFVGIEGFAQILPQDWLQVIDAHHVKLPNYHIHNGTVAKKTALTNKRVNRHRLQRNADALQPCNADALPDQDQDLYLKKKNTKKKIACRLPDDFTLTAQRSDYAVTHGLSAGETFDAFCDYWRAANGPNAIKRDWDAAWRTWVRSPYNAPKLNGAAARPALPAPAAVLRDSAEWSELLAAGRAEGLGEPYKLETPQAYAERLRGFRAKLRPKVDTSALTNKLRTLL
jgi:hypothetical protein